MRNHMMKRLQVPDDILKNDMENLANELDNMSHEQVVASYKKVVEIPEFDHRIARIDAIQAELWRRSQLKEGG